jgi:hypothetical protein
MKLSRNSWTKSNEARGSSIVRETALILRFVVIHCAGEVAIDLSLDLKSALHSSLNSN